MCAAASDVSMIAALDAALDIDDLIDLAATPVGNVQDQLSEFQMMMVEIKRINDKTEEGNTHMRAFFTTEMAALSAASAKGLAATDTLAELGIAQRKSFEEAVSAFAAARKEQMSFNQATDTAIASMREAVDSMQKQLIELQSNDSTVSSNAGDTRPFKASRTELGKGGYAGQARQRGASAQPQRPFDQAESQLGDPCVCHVVLPVEVVSSRLHTVVSLLVKGCMPTCTDFHVRARAKSAAITFGSAGTTSIFVNRMIELGKEKYITIGKEGADGGTNGVKYLIQVKHDETWPVRRRKYVASRVWTAIAELFQKANSKALVLKLDQRTGKIAA
jgi:hypothetical protein